jgi:hypothetical protein
VTILVSDGVLAFKDYCLLSKVTGLLFKNLALSIYCIDSQKFNLAIQRWKHAVIDSPVL